MDRKISIIGGGVSGITTALTLQLLGFETKVYAELLVDDNAPQDPRFASLYPAASIIPHSIRSECMDQLFPASLAIFDALHNKAFEPLVTHRHYELYEFPVELPSYTKYLRDFTTVDQITDVTLPKRRDVSELFGWAFNCYVTEWPAYMHALYGLYRSAGGEIIRKKVTKEQIKNLPGDVLINCSGAWSSELFDDPAEHHLIRGHLVHLPNQRPIKDAQKRTVSYNYTPNRSVYSTPQGKPADVYFYPIGDKWVFGGSRQPGNPDDQGYWEGDEHDDTILMSGEAVPEPVLELNKEILAQAYGIELDFNSINPKAYAGYRYTRSDTKNGLRLQADHAYGKEVIHNYGHGGGGVTVSWGCALKVIQLIQQVTGFEVSKVRKARPDPILNCLQLRLQQVYWNDFHSSTPDK